MAESYHQTITKPRLYVSYPLFLYASGGMESVRNHLTGSDNLSDEDLYKLITITPQEQITIPVESDNNWLAWRLLPNSFDNNFENPEGLAWTSDNGYVMALAHNSKSANIKMYPVYFEEQDDGTLINETRLDVSDIVNGSTMYDLPQHDGWSVMKFADTLSPESKYFGWRLKYTADIGEQPYLKLGSLLFGKFFDLPQNAELNQRLDFDYGVKNKKTLSGKTISTMNWNKTDNWITEPFGLGEETGDNPFRRSGRRTWTINFSSLLPKYVTSQNMMLNNNKYIAQDNHETTDSGVGYNSTYNAYNSTDFYTNVVKMTMGGHLPMVMCINQNDVSPSNWAIVRMSKYSITQKTPNLYNFKIKLEEQI